MQVTCACPDQLRVFWMLATLKMKISSQKPQLAVLISPPLFTTHAHARTQRLISAHGGHIAPVFTKPVSVKKKKKRKRTKGDGGSVSGNMGAMLTALRCYDAAVQRPVRRR